MQNHFRKTYFIVRYSRHLPARAVAFTNDIEVAREICTREETHNVELGWFWGFTEQTQIAFANVNMLPKAEDCLKDICANPGKKVRMQK